MKAKRDFSLPQPIIRVIGLSVPIKLFSGCRVRVTGYGCGFGMIFATDMINWNKITVELSNSFPFVFENSSDFSYKAHLPCWILNVTKHFWHARNDRYWGETANIDKTGHLAFSRFCRDRAIIWLLVWLIWRDLTRQLQVPYLFIRCLSEIETCFFLV